MVPPDGRYAEFIAVFADIAKRQLDGKDFG